MTAFALGLSFLIAGYPTLPAAPVAHGQPEPVDTMVSVGDHLLHLVIRRGPRPVTIVLEAGGGSDLGGWYDVPALLARETGATVVAYDRAGFGRSGPGAPDLAPDQEVANLYRALRAVAAPEHTIHVGHSYGALLALLAAARFPDRVQGVVLVDPMNPRFVEQTGDFVFSTVQRIERPSTDRERALVRMIDGFRGLVREAGALEPTLPQPMVIVTAGQPWWGRADIDRAWRRSHADMAAASPRRRLIVAERSRHLVPQEEPEAVVAALELLLPPDRPSSTGDPPDGNDPASLQTAPRGPALATRAVRLPCTGTRSCSRRQPEHLDANRSVAERTVLSDRLSVLKLSQGDVNRPGLLRQPIEIHPRGVFLFRRHHPGRLNRDSVPGGGSAWKSPGSLRCSSRS